jgi:hypothetical protein
MAQLGRLLNDREATYLRASITIDTEQLSLGDVTALLLAQVKTMEAAFRDAAETSAQSRVAE